MKTTFIYALTDPLTNKVKYIGKADNPEKRRKEHIKRIKYPIKKGKRLTFKERWVFNLLLEGLEPEQIILDEVVDYEKWESFYIKQYKDMGCELTNYDDDGVGNKNKIREFQSKTIDVVRKPVFCYSLDGSLITKYQSCRAAAIELGLSHANISRCCNGEYFHSGGYHFSYCEKEADRVTPLSIKKIVCRINKDGKLINMYNSIGEAARANFVNHANVSRVCNGKLKHTKGLFFKFKEDETI
jgi:hypothetical protein